MRGIKMAEEVKLFGQIEVKEESIYDQIGGEESIVAAVAIFYEKVLNDNLIKHYFEGVDMLGQVIHQQNFLRAALGGKIPYTGRGLYLAHQNLKISDSHFGQVAYHLQQTLLELKVPQDIIDKIMAIAGSVKDDIVAKQTEAAAAASKTEQKSSDKPKKCPFHKTINGDASSKGKLSFYQKMLISGLSTASLAFAVVAAYLIHVS